MIRSLTAGKKNDSVYNSVIKYQIYPEELLNICLKTIKTSLSVCVWPFVPFLGGHQYFLSEGQWRHHAAWRHDPDGELFLLALAMTKMFEGNVQICIPVHFFLEDAALWRCGAPHFLFLQPEQRSWTRPDQAHIQAAPLTLPLLLLRCTRAHRARKHTKQPLSHYTQSLPPKYARARACVFNTAPDACLLSSSPPCLYLSHALCLVNYTETGGLSSLIWKVVTPRRADPVTLSLTPKSSPHRPAGTQIHMQKQYTWHLFTVRNAYSNCIKRAVLAACGSFGAFQSWLLFRSFFFFLKRCYKAVMFTGMLMEFQASARSTVAEFSTLGKYGLTGTLRRWNWVKCWTELCRSASVSC